MVASRASFGFGLARSLDFHASLSTFTELCELLGRDIGTVVYPHHALSYDALGAGLERGELGLAWMPPIPAIEALDRAQVVLLVAPVRRGSTMYHSALLVRPNGPTTLEGMRGLRVGWVDRASAGGHLVPKMHLAAQGHPLRGFFAHEVFLGSHIAVIDALLSERIDVGATFCQIQPETGRVVHAAWTSPDGTIARPVQALTTIGPIPSDVVVASSRLSNEVQHRVLRWFLAPPSARAKQLLAQIVRADLCRSVAPSHFGPLRRMMVASAARGETPWRDRGSLPPPR